MSKMYSSFSLVIFCLLFALSVQGQAVSIGLERNQVFYAGVDNPITIAVSNFKCEDVKVFINNGQVVSNGGCNYTVNTKEPGESILKVSVIKDKKQQLLGEYNFVVKPLPTPSAMVAGKSGGYVRKEFLKIQNKMELMVLGFDIDAKFQHLGFSCMVMKHNEAEGRFIGKSANAEISQDMKAAFGQLEKGDTVFFYKIVARGPDGNPLAIDPVVYYIR